MENARNFNVPPRSKFIGRDSTINLVQEALANPTLGHKACLLGIRGIGLVAPLREIKQTHKSASRYFGQTLRGVK